MITLGKKGGNTIITFSPDKQDSHFVNIQLLNRKSGAVRCEHYILAADVKTWRSYYASDGYKQIIE